MATCRSKGSRASRNDPHVVANALVEWLDRRHDGPGVATVEAFATRAADPELSRALAALDEQLWGRQIRPRPSLVR